MYSRHERKFFNPTMVIALVNVKGFFENLPGITDVVTNGIGDDVSLRGYNDPREVINIIPHRLREIISDNLMIITLPSCIQKNRRQKIKIELNLKPKTEYLVKIKLL